MNDLPVGARVALKPDFEDVYTHAVSGSEGFVRDRKVDDDGFPLVLIEWDQEHWRFNGQPDGWTFESHFKLSEKQKPRRKKRAPASNEDLITSFDDDGLEEEEKMDEFLDNLGDAMESASEGEGFMIISIRREEVPGDPEKFALIPEIFTSTITEEANILLDAQISQCASAVYQEMMMKMVELYMAQRRKNGGL
jgi:hypothetical protein